MTTISVDAPAGASFAELGLPDAMVDALAGNPLFGHVVLTRSERSEIAALVGRLLDDA